ncbi:MAG: ARMT1-like domain-containing protein [Lachnospiraceae bacterium]|nr:ARMT1-like domain-containing protein [Lachnospiraceae bacterium]
MRIPESCAKCLYDRQLNKTDNAEYLAEIKDLLDNRGADDTSPYMVYLFNRVHERYFGKGADYKDIKKRYNDLVLGMESGLQSEIDKSEDPLARALVMSRIGNYIDYGAMDHVDQDEFMALFKDTGMQERDIPVYNAFLRACEKGSSFLLVCDNCGEIVLDRLMIKQLKKRFPHLTVKALVRGKEVLNDATKEDAHYTGLDKVAEIISNGDAVAGTIYDMMPDEAKTALDEADVILAKGQGNYESMSGQGRHVFYAFLCKCDLFMRRFGVPKLTGIFVEENEELTAVLKL